MIQSVLEKIDELFPSTVSFLQQMIREPSVQGNEAGVQQLVESRLKVIGLETDKWDPPYAELKNHSLFVPSRPDLEQNGFTGSPNVVGVWRGAGGGKSIILNGHIDVVPAGDLSRWTDDPFSGKVEGDRMYGRGTTDMKGGNVALLLAVEAIMKSGVRLKGDVIFESVMEEETGGTGTLATVLRGYKADAAIIPEPTNMRLFIRQQGSMWFRVSVRGRSAHAGTRYEGVSALEKTWLLWRAIMDLEKKRNENIIDPLYKNAPIPLPINIGTIQGGSWPSMVPDLITFEGRIGVGPTEEMDAVKALLRQTIADTCAQDPWMTENPATVEFFGGQWVPNSVDADHPFTQTVIREFTRHYGVEPKVEASPWGTDAGILGRGGNIPALVIGPGETRVAHYPDEFIDLQEVRLAAGLFARIIIDWCEPA